MLFWIFCEVLCNLKRFGFVVRSDSFAQLKGVEIFAETDIFLYVFRGNRSSLWQNQREFREFVVYFAKVVAQKLEQNVDCFWFGRETVRFKSSFNPGRHL